MKTAAVITNNLTSEPTSCSPASKEKQLFDLSLMKEKSQPVRRALFSKPDSAANSSATPGADDSSVSTVGSNTSGLYSTGSARRRSLFSKYWVKTGESPSSTTARPRPHTAIIEIADDQLSQEEESTQHTPDVVVAQSPTESPLVPRRSLFAHHETRRSASLNCLDEVGEDLDDASTSSSLLNGASPVRHKSEGELISCSKSNTKPVSCLRESRFSFTKRDRLSDSLRKSSSSVCSEASSVVQFDMESMEVRHFLKPAEVHAEDGWTNYFY